MTDKINLKNKIISIQKANTIKDLIGVYEMMINSIDNLSREHIDKINDFINDLGSIGYSFTDKEKDQSDEFDKDPLLVDLLRNNLMHLYTNRLTRKYGNPGIKDE